MTVCPKTVPAVSSLSGSEGDLISISIDVDPRDLESLLETLSQTSFPVNPQVYHDAVMVYQYADRREEVATTLVEFPAYAGRLEEVRRALEAYGFDPASAQAAGMLDAIHAECLPEPAPAGAPYLSRFRRRYRVATAGH
ncbi:MAG: hypothetical protein LAP87_00140 [Acidobacteriia bacterium]|nr:hypothetical protein [Terriglobia bacterium]